MILENLQDLQDCTQPLSLKIFNLHTCSFFRWKTVRQVLNPYSLQVSVFGKQLPELAFPCPLSSPLGALPWCSFWTCSPGWGIPSLAVHWRWRFAQRGTHASPWSGTACLHPAQSHRMCPAVAASPGRSGCPDGSKGWGKGSEKQGGGHKLLGPQDLPPWGYRQQTWH